MNNKTYAEYLIIATLWSIGFFNLFRSIELLIGKGKKTWKTWASFGLRILLALIFLGVPIPLYRYLHSAGN